MRLDTAALKPADVLVQMLAAPITSVDLAQIAGSASYPSAPSGAAAASGGARVCGNEGLGIVLEAASGSGLKKGDVVAPAQGGLGTWASHVIAPGSAWARVGADVASMGAVEAVAAGIAPVLTAQHLLADFVQLKSGAWGSAALRRAAAPRQPRARHSRPLPRPPLLPFPALSLSLSLCARRRGCAQ